MKTIQFFLFVCLIPILFIGNAYGQSQQFVSLHGDKFRLNGEDFYPVVANYRVSIYEEDANNYEFFVGPSHSSLPNNTVILNEAHAEALLKADFKSIKDMGFNTIRVVGLTFGKYCLSGESNSRDCTTWSLNPAFSFRTKPPNSITEVRDIKIEDSYDTYFSFIQKVISIASLPGINLKIIFVAGGKQLDTPDVKNEFEGNDLIISGYLEQLVQEVANNNAMFAYDFWNEPSYNDATYYGQLLQVYPKSDVCYMVSKWNNIVHDNSDYQLTTIGLGLVTEVFEWDPGVMKLDFLSFHFYPDNLQGRTTDPLLADITLAHNMVKNQLYWYSKTSSLPWIVGETGFSASYNNDIKYDYGTTDDQANYAETTLNYCRDCRGSGYSWWMYKDKNYGAAPSSYWGLITRDGNLKSAHEIFKNFNPHVFSSCNIPDNYYDLYNYEGTGSTIEGWVKNQNGDAIENAVVVFVDRWWTGEAFKTFTNEDGYFKVYTNLPYDKTNMRLKISAPGSTIYDTADYYLNQIIPEENPIILCEFKPEYDDYPLNGVTVNINEKYYFEASNSITATNVTIEGNGSIGGILELKACNNIFLNTGFHAKKGCTFLAYNGPIYMDCNYLDENCNKSQLKAMVNNTLETNGEIIISSENTISVFPNPTNDIININLPLSRSCTSIKILDIHGNILFVKEYTQDDNKIVINAASYKKGVYTIVIVNEEYSATRKVVLQ